MKTEYLLLLFINITNTVTVFSRVSFVYCVHSLKLFLKPMKPLRPGSHLSHWIRFNPVPNGVWQTSEQNFVLSWHKHWFPPNPCAPPSCQPIMGRHLQACLRLSDTATKPRVQLRNPLGKSGIGHECFLESMVNKQMANPGGGRKTGGFPILSAATWGGGLCYCSVNAVIIWSYFIEHVDYISWLP